MDNKKVGDYIKEQRIKHKLSQKKLSETVHVTRQAVSNWENGKAIPDSEILIKLSELFNVSINEILLGSESQDELQKMTLNLIDENNKKKNKIDNLFKSLILVLIVFLSYYFLTTYNSIKVYRISGKSKNYSFDNSILIHTNQKTYLKIGNIEPKEDIKKITLYYVDNKSKKEIYSGEDIEKILVEEYGYGEYFNRNFSRIKDNLYIKIDSSTNEEVIRLKLSEDFKNSELFYNKKPVKEDNKTDFSDTANEIYNSIENQIEKSSTTNIDNNKKEENKPNEEIRENKNEIDYDKVINKLIENGTKDVNTYRMMYEKDNLKINICLAEGELSIDTAEDNIIKSYVINLNSEKTIKYIKYENFFEVENMEIDYRSSIEKDVNIIKEIEKILDDFLKGNF